MASLTDTVYKWTRKFLGIPSDFTSLLLGEKGEEEWARGLPASLQHRPTAPVPSQVRAAPRAQVPLPLGRLPLQAEVDTGQRLSIQYSFSGRRDIF